MHSLPLHSPSSLPLHLSATAARPHSFGAPGSSHTLSQQPFGVSEVLPQPPISEQQRGARPRSIGSFRRAFWSLQQQGSGLSSLLLLLQHNTAASHSLLCSASGLVTLLAAVSRLFGRRSATFPIHRRRSLPTPGQQLQQPLARHSHCILQTQSRPSADHAARTACSTWFTVELCVFTPSTTPRKRCLRPVATFF